MTAERTLYVIGTAAPPLRQLADACHLAADRGWRPCVVLTPTASTWVDLDRLRDATGMPVRVHPRVPHEQDPLPAAAAVLAAPLTFNTVNKWAGGISDTLALGLLNELLSSGLPIVAAPCVKPTLQAHPAYPANVERLTNAGVRFLDQDKITTRAEDGLIAFNWPCVLDSLGAA